MTGKAPEKNRQVEQDLLSEIVTLHPDHLTPAELVLWMRGRTSDADRIAILDALQVLKRSGLTRQNGDVVEPTYATLCVAEIFQIP